MQLAPPPPPPAAAAPVVIRSESAVDMVVSQDRKLTLTRAKQTEAAVARYQIVLRTDVVAYDATPPGDGSFPAIRCEWKLETYLQRQPCFWSLSGLFACADASASRLPEGEIGETRFEGPSTETLPKCEVTATQIAAARNRVVDGLTRSGPSRIDADLRQSLRPILAKGGTTVTVAP